MGGQDVSPISAPFPPFFIRHGKPEYSGSTAGVQRDPAPMTAFVAIFDSVSYIDSSIFKFVGVKCYTHKYSSKKERNFSRFFTNYDTE